MAFSQLLKGNHKKDKKIFTLLIRCRCNLLSKQETISIFYNYLVIRTLVSHILRVRFCLDTTSAQFLQPRAKFYPLSKFSQSLLG